MKKILSVLLLVIILGGAVGNEAHASKDLFPKLTKTSSITVDHLK
ncbi:hypothetical protein [Sporosarcina sp. FSL K6-1508]